jgi:hypothetical protein
MLVVLHGVLFLVCHPNPLARLIGANLKTTTMMVAMMVQRDLAEMVRMMSKAVALKTTQKTKKVAMRVLMRVLLCYLHFAHRLWPTICQHRLYMQPLAQVL